MDKDTICNIAAQWAGVAYHGSSRLPKVGRLAIFQPSNIPSSFGLAIDRMDSAEIARRVRAQSFLRTLVWHGLIEDGEYEWCIKCGAYHAKGGECPNECPEQEHCAGECGAHHDIDGEDGWKNRQGEWVCDKCKEDACDSDSSAIADFESVGAYRAREKRFTEATIALGNK